MTYVEVVTYNTFQLKYLFKHLVLASCLFLACLALLWPKFVNFNPFLGYSLVNNFLDIVLSLGNLIVLILVFFELFRQNILYKFFVLGLLTISLWQINLANPSLDELASMIIFWSNLVLWLAILVGFWRWFRQPLFKIWLIVLGAYSLLDHLLLSSPFGVLLAWVIFQIIWLGFISGLLQKPTSLLSQIKSQKSFLFNSGLENLNFNNWKYLKHDINTFQRLPVQSGQNLLTPFLKNDRLNFEQTSVSSKNSSLATKITISGMSIFKQILNYTENIPKILFTSVLFLLTLFFIQNLVVATGQVITGHNLGLQFLGEPPVSLNTRFTARQPIGDYYLVLLRGYGLMQHPNILGFVGILGFWLAILLKKYNTNYRLKSLSWWLKLISGAIVVLSFSRIAWISLIFLILVYFLDQKIGLQNLSSELLKTKIFEFIKQKWYILSSFIITFGFVFFSRFAYSYSSDWVRINEYVRFWETFWQLPWWQKIFGIGLGQYPFYHRSYNSDLALSIHQPIHNLWLMLFFELGIFWFSVLIFCLSILYKNQRN